MNGRMKCSCVLAVLTLVMMAGLPGPAIAQQAKLYEIVENLDGITLQTTGHRISSWTAQGSAEPGSPFCPLAVLPPGASSCAITAFGTDNIDLTAVANGAVVVGSVWANVVAVANLDNVVDAPELAVFSGQITGRITIQADVSVPEVTTFQKKKAMMGPAIPLIFVRNGRFFADPVPVIRTSPPADLPSGVATARFDSTFRLPFTVNRGRRERPGRGGRAFYLADDGSFIRVDRQDEFSQGFALVRAEVFFR